jgi:hypothetical protein
MRPRRPEAASFPRRSQADSFSGSTASGERAMMGGIRKDLPPNAIPIPKVPTTNSPRPLKRVRENEQRISQPKERPAANDKPD